jgi:hypothetical protein
MSHVFISTSAKTLMPLLTSRVHSARTTWTCGWTKIKSGQGLDRRMRSEAITQGAFFMACFSTAYIALGRDRT